VGLPKDMRLLITTYYKHQFSSYFIRSKSDFWRFKCLHGV